jgi:prepilin-type N-terminal cleavage/methylation domain-containing protein
LKLNSKFKKNILSHHGFSLIEVMVALVLVVMMFGLIPKGTFGGSREDLENSVLDVERAVRFAVNESILRNSIVRVSFNISEEKTTYVVEYGSGANLILPESVDESRLSIKEKEQQKKLNKTLDSQFNKVDEFSDKDKVLPEGITISGIGSSYFGSIKYDGNISIYFYPTGEKDNALIFFSSQDELITLDIPPFEDTTSKEYYTFTDQDKNNLLDSIDSIMKGKFEKWLKD